MYVMDRVGKLGERTKSVAKKGFPSQRNLTNLKGQFHRRDERADFREHRFYLWGNKLFTIRLSMDLTRLEVLPELKNPQDKI